MATPPDTTTQAAARKVFDDASRELAAATVRLKEAQAAYDACVTKYNIAFGMASQAGVLP